MSLDDYATQFFIDHSIDYENAEINMCKVIPTAFFEDDKNIEYRTITIPDNTTHNYFMYHFSKNEHVRNLYNLRLGRLTEPEEFTYGTPSETYTLVTDYTHDEDEVLIAGRHGDGLVFDTEEDERDVIMEVSVVRKTPAQLDEEIRDVIRYMYYHLYTENKDQYYNYLRRLSILKKNRMAENVKTKPSRKIYHSVFEPLSM
jgi:hypothetical protein